MTAFLGRGVLFSTSAVGFVYAFPDAGRVTALFPAAGWTIAAFLVAIPYCLRFRGRVRDVVWVTFVLSVLLTLPLGFTLIEPATELEFEFVMALGVSTILGAIVFSHLRSQG